MSNDKARMTKECRSPNDKWPFRAPVIPFARFTKSQTTPLDLSTCVIRHSFVIRHSSFLGHSSFQIKGLLGQKHMLSVAALIEVLQEHGRAGLHGFGDSYRTVDPKRYRLREVDRV